MAGQLMNVSSLDYFTEQVWRETSECIIWPRGRTTNGYGTLKTPSGMRLAHALAAEVRLGPRPMGHEVAHGPCHNRLCFNYRHLAYKTRAQNIAYKTRAQNIADMRRDGTDPSGERNGHARITWADVAEIRSSRESTTVLAERYGVTPRHLRAVRQGRFWKESA